MRTLLTLTIIFQLAFFSCKKDDSVSIELSGKYSETVPKIGRSQLEFITGHKVVKTETGSSYRDTLVYEISGGTMKLTPVWDNSYSTQLDIEIVTNSKFIIENLYPSIPEYEKVYMTFEKK
jgi:hypothetical protein